MDRSRRALLAAFGTALSASVAGCPGTESDADTAEPTVEPTTESSTAQTTARPNTATQPETTTVGPVTLEPGESYTTEAGWELVVENVVVRAAVVEHGPTHWDPRWSDDGQFVVADVAVTGEDAPDPAELHVACETDTADGSGPIFVAADSNVDDVRQRVGFAVPASPAPADGAIVWTPDDGPEVRWVLSDDRLAAIARPPEFDLREFAVEDAPGDEVTVTLTVANTGAGDGTFLAEVGNAAMSDQPELTVEVPAGETRTVTRRVWADFGGEETMTVVFRWRDERLERTLEAAGGTVIGTQTITDW